MKGKLHIIETLLSCHFPSTSSINISMLSYFARLCSIIEEGFIQKARQTVIVSVWGTRSYAAMGIFFGLNAWNCVHSCCTFPFTFVGGGGMFYVDLYFKF